MADNSAGSKVSFFLVGLGIGSLIGLLFAPKIVAKTHANTYPERPTKAGNTHSAKHANCANAPKI